VKLIEKIVTGAANFLAVAGLTVLLALAVCTLFDGLLRALANYPLDFVREIGDLIAAICGACCLPIVLLHKNNIVLRTFENLLPPGGARVFDIFADVLMTVVMAVMAWQFWLFGIKTKLANDVTWMMNVPKAPFWFAVDGVLWVCVLVQAFVTVQTLMGKSARHDTEIPL
jgi:TRAP-type C4-dicarboxylate transport system permease small subunit